jgi:hypothetical protein
MKQLDGKMFRPQMAAASGTHQERSIDIRAGVSASGSSDEI